MRTLARLSILMTLPLLAAACGIGSLGHGYRQIPKDSTLIIGTTDHVTTLDPAGSYENGSYTLYGQIYPFLLNFPYGSDKPTPDAAERCDFAEPVRFRCVLRPNQKFANGHALTSKSVKFSFDRITRINDPNGPQSLLHNLDRIETPDPRTVDFFLKVPNDQTFAQVLAAMPGPILDEQVFPADRVLSDDDIVAKAPFAGPYTIATYRKNDLVLLQARDGYRGIYGRPAMSNVVFRYYANAGNLKLDLLERRIDAVYHSLSTTDYDELAHTTGVKVFKGSGGDMRYLVFNKGAQPGQTDEQKLAVRKAVAASVDRQALARDVYHGQFEPAWSVVPDGTIGSVPAFREAYGDRPDTAKAEGFLRAAGIPTPVTLRLQYTPEHYGPSSSEEYALIKAQLEATGLFQVQLQSTEWTVYNHEYAKGSYPLFQLGWFPDFPDPDNYLTPFFVDENFINNGFADPVLVQLIQSELGEPDRTRRAAVLAQAQREAAQLVSVIPLLTGHQIFVTTDHVTGQQQAVSGPSKLLVGSLRTTGGSAA
jgi:peptide/nickel transport system substrate-binding protein